MRRLMCGVLGRHRTEEVEQPKKRPDQRVGLWGHAECALRAFLTRRAALPTHPTSVSLPPPAHSHRPLCPSPPPRARVIGAHAPRVCAEAAPADAILVPRHPPTELLFADLFAAGAPTVATVGRRRLDDVAQRVHVAVGGRLIVHRLDVHAADDCPGVERKREATGRERGGSLIASSA